MNQSELIEKVVQVTELNQKAAGQAVEAVVNAILASLVAGEDSFKGGQIGELEENRVSGLVPSRCGHCRAAMSKPSRCHSEHGRSFR
ncbi:MAG: HU family DNA-binding protein [Alphaproteobacteria bacterium]|nr:HU family DNA-binding protein [Alphaproteobacteria bacterium]MBV9377209.1 HU family DNA-binding protein [Alphaproteobacteria bacterium]